MDVTRDEAEQRAATLQAEDPERDAYRFVPRESEDGVWHVARVRVPGPLRPPTLTPTVGARPRPPHADDPRSGHERRAPGMPGGLVG